MAASKYYLVMNPSSNSGKSRKAFKKIISELERRRAVFDYKITNGPKDATLYTAEAINNGWDVMVAVGGDGTICEVISGFFCSNNHGNNAKLGVLHVGTSPDFNRYHNIPICLEEALGTLFSGRRKKIDVGRIIYRDKDSKPTLSYFGSNVNVGLGPLIADRANSRHRKYLGDFLGTLCSTLGSLIRFKGIDLNIRIDGKKIDVATLINVTVGKDPYLASGMRILNNITPDDGRLYIFFVAKKSVVSFLANIPKLYMGDFLKYKGTGLVYGKKVEIGANSHGLFPIEFDGDTKGYLPVEIEVISKSLEVIVP